MRTVTSTPTPAPRLLRNALIVFAGGALGALLRGIGMQLWPSGIIVPDLWLIFWANIIGAFLLGVIAGWAARGSGRDDVRLLLGTGLCGGFTTYSAIAGIFGHAILSLTDFLREIAIIMMTGVAVGQLLFGLAATALGWRIGHGPDHDAARTEAGA